LTVFYKIPEKVKHGNTALVLCGGVTVVIAGTRRTRYTGGENRSLLDQLAHLAVIALVVAWTRAPSRSELAGVAVLLADPRALACAIGYTLLLNPAWVLLRLTVRGV
jgi:hypothetical protein